MSTYPIILNNLETQPVLVVGGGKIAEDKVVQLIDAGAGCITVISPKLTGGLIQLFAADRIRWAPRLYRPGDLESDPPFLAIAATDDPAVNRLVADEARRARVLVNAVDDPPNCDFYAVSVVRQGSLTIGIGTDGQMPALAARLRAKFERGFGSEYGRLLEIAREMRPELARRFPDFAQRRRVWYALADAPLIPMLRRGDSEADVRTFAWQVVEQAAGEQVDADAVPERVDAGRVRGSEDQ